jgi:hypothetical protein
MPAEEPVSSPPADQTAGNPTDPESKNKPNESSNDQRE